MEQPAVEALARRGSIDSGPGDPEWENASTLSGTSTADGDFVGKLFSRVRHNRGREAEALLDSGQVPVDSRDDKGCTPLMIACQNGHKRMVKMLLKRYADPNIRNNAGQTALHFCFRFGHTELGEYIISKGGDQTIPVHYPQVGGYVGYSGMSPPEPAMPCPPGQQLPAGLVPGPYPNGNPNGTLPVQQLHNPPTPQNRTKRKDKVRTVRAPLPSTVRDEPALPQMSVIVDTTSPPASLEAQQMPTWSDMGVGGLPRPPDLVQQIEGEHSGYVDVEAMAAALPGVRLDDRACMPKDSQGVLDHTNGDQMA